MYTSLFIVFKFVNYLDHRQCEWNIKNGNVVSDVKCFTTLIHSRQVGDPVACNRFEFIFQQFRGVTCDVNTVT